MKKRPASEVEAGCCAHLRSATWHEQLLEAHLLLNAFSHRKTTSAATMEKAMNIQLSEREWVSNISMANRLSSRAK